MIGISNTNLCRSLLRALQSEVLPVAIGTRNTIYGLLKLRAMDHSHFRLARQNEV